MPFHWEIYMHISQNSVLITAVKFLMKAIAFFIVGKLIISSLHLFSPCFLFQLLICVQDEWDGRKYL